MVVSGWGRNSSTSRRCLRRSLHGTHGPRAWRELREGRKIRVSGLARRFNLSRRTLDRKFSAHVGRPAGEYLQAQRLDLALHLLRSTKLPLGEISDRCGFTKQDTLSTRFKQTHGMTPREFPREQRLSG